MQILRQSVFAQFLAHTLKPLRNPMKLTFILRQITKFLFYFLDREHAKGGKTLVHCRAGISRSATICLAYLIKTRGYGWEQAYNFVKQKRNMINPNFNFMGQLQKFEQECKEEKGRRQKEQQNETQSQVSPKSPKEMKMSPKYESINNNNMPMTAAVNPKFKIPFSAEKTIQQITPNSSASTQSTPPVSFFTFSGESNQHNNSQPNVSPHSRNSPRNSVTSTTCGNQSPSPVQTPSPTAIVK